MHIRTTKEMLEDAMLQRGYRRDCCIIAVGGGVSEQGLLSTQALHLH